MLSEGTPSMPHIKFEGKEYRTDEDGFIQDPDKWSPELAEFLANIGGIPALTPDHWKVVDFIRSYYLKVGMAPLIATLRRETGFDLRQIYELFPAGPAKGACKVAGLPKPTGCV